MKAYFPLLAVMMILGGCVSADKQLASQTTETLKAKHDHLLAGLGYYKGNAEIDIIKPVWRAGPTRSAELEEKEAIERELLRRFKAGEQAAHLPIFGGKG